MCFHHSLWKSFQNVDFTSLLPKTFVTKTLHSSGLLPGKSRVPSMAENREPRGAVDAELDPVEYTLRKRLPHRLPRRPNDIYVNMKTDFKAQLARCQKLLDGGARGQNACSEIYIHGLGLAINRAINIALQLQAGSFGALQVAANTSTVELVDELEPETDAREPLTRTRNNSAIHIRVFRVTPK
ncbi:ribonuclease P protein subunit p20 isoform X1 [Choloepus didactylus]|uniref:ribonuclease P protein subunit p20 isoform X1 n=2 Tax=Choloepus didactylus TaxID=27675 RepID=UPI0018A03898|nr:ribonuclease P protein subunit p20 isoform X1 [Choloepus didactylus]